MYLCIVTSEKLYNRNKQMTNLIAWHNLLNFVYEKHDFM